MASTTLLGGRHQPPFTERLGLPANQSKSLPPCRVAECSSVCLGDRVSSVPSCLLQDWHLSTASGATSRVAVLARILTGPRTGPRTQWPRLTPQEWFLLCAMASTAWWPGIQVKWTLTGGMVSGRSHLSVSSPATQVGGLHSPAGASRAEVPPKADRRSATLGCPGN